jgi:BlaR1 peptidase M56
VQRRDDWIGLLQALLHAALWVHPGAAWIGRQINLEREVACDDWVVSRTGAPREYARCLARVAEMRRPARVPAFAAAWSAGRGHLVRRVNRLLETHRNARRSPSMAAMVAGVAAVAVVALQLRACPLIAETRQGLGFGVRGSGFLGPGSVPSFLATAERAPSSDVSAGTWSAASGNRNVAPRTPNPELRTRNREPRTRNPEPGSGNPEPGTPNPGLGTRNPEPTAPAPVDDASVIAARTFEGTYIAAAVPSVPERSQTNPWRLAGQAGAEVGAAARKAGVRVASSVTRASVSVVRVF